MPEWRRWQPVSVRQGVRARHRDAAVRQRRTAAGEISAEAPDDRPDQPAAAARDAVFGLQRRRHHPEQCFFRPLSSGGRAARHRSGQVHPGDQGQGRPSAQAVAERDQEASRGRTRRRQSMLGQQPRIFQSPRRRRPIGQWRDGQCALARRAAQDRARQGRRAAGRQAGHLQRHGRTGRATRRRISSRRSTSTMPATAR